VAADGSRSGFDPGCRRCPRLAGFLDDVRRRYPAYHARPVPSFGDAGTRLLVVGLAPGLHGANATGRPFTGDFAGILLFETLHEFGFASAGSGRSADDGLRLFDCRITNAVRCVPPENRPVTREIVTCNGYLRQELAALPVPAVVLALGSIAHGAVLRALGLGLARFPFAHGRRHEPRAGLQLFDSYHCSRYNTQTRRLTPEMFRAVLAAVRRAVDVAGHASS
jgi:uracil-DNA glycosylase family 4